jgi:hypothetical protein
MNGGRRIGIVGAAADKFTTLGRVRAKALIVKIITDNLPNPVVVSGACHLGGVDAWAEEAADCSFEFPHAKRIFPARNRAWGAPGGYRERNLQIVEFADEVHSIVVDCYPPSFADRKFDLCYHCGTADHVKSGGCWTVKMARRAGKPGYVHVVQN